MNRRSVVALPFAALAAPRPGRAQAAWAPSRPVVLVVPFAPGGPNDVVARLVAPHMQAALGQNVVVENRPGATGAIGARHVAGAPPDGHTLLVAASGTMTINPAVMARPGYDPEKDFSPVSLAMTTSPSRVLSQRRGRRPLRSSTLPITRPSVKHIAAGPSHGSIRQLLYS